MKNNNTSQIFIIEKDRIKLEKKERQKTTNKSANLSKMNFGKNKTNEKNFLQKDKNTYEHIYPNKDEKKRKEYLIFIQ